MRPPPGEYALPSKGKFSNWMTTTTTTRHYFSTTISILSSLSYLVFVWTDGVFLLLGYSSTDEALLRPHTNLGIQDAVRALQQYVIKHVDNQTSCTLTLYNMTDENIILSVRLPHDSKANALSLLKQEKVSKFFFMSKLLFEFFLRNSNETKKNTFFLQTTTTGSM